MLSIKSSPELARHDIHWKAPSLTVLCLTPGIGFALGHHFFHSHLNQRVVGNKSHQQWVTKAGNAAAFIAKISLIAVASAAYAQCSLRAD
jgi:hypothetical protein